MVGGGDGSIALFSENLKPIGGKKETLMGGVTSLPLPRMMRTCLPPLRWKVIDTALP